MFVILVAAWLPYNGGFMHNIEIGFPTRPDLATFLGHAEATYRGECARLRPANVPVVHRFVCESVRVFDDTLNRWLDCNSSHQLQNWCQVFLFQPDVDVNQAILNPPLRIRSPVEVGRGKDKIFFLFHDVDFNGNGYLSLHEINSLFNRMGIFNVSEKSVEQQFLRADSNRDGMCSFAEFSAWMKSAPEIAELLLAKSVEYWQACRAKPDVRDSSEISAQERAAIEQYLERCYASASHAASASRTRSIKELEDEKLLLQREEELRRARDAFRGTYGRELGVPTSNSVVLQSSFASRGGAAASVVTGARGGNTPQSKTAQAQQQQQQQPRATTPTRAAFGSTFPPRKKTPVKATSSGGGSAKKQAQSPSAGASAVSASASPSAATAASPKPSTPLPEEK